ncbi:hydrogenase expression protein [Pseudomonas syringae]|nr:hydrogenase expression protein [Pseudomonas syringae]RXT90088.1 hydrogenase expression protein [Pseudomonas syringae]
MQFSTLCVVKRTRSVQKGMRRRAPHDSRACTCPS